MKKIFLSYFFIALLFNFYFGCTAFSKPLVGAKGQVIDLTTGKPIAGAKVFATTESDIESEQRYARITATTTKDGTFKITGLPLKNYKIFISKEGYTSVNTWVQMPGESVRLITEPVKLCLIPTQGSGVYLYTDRFIKLDSKPYETYEIKGTDNSFIFYEAKNLINLSPMRAKFLIIYNLRHLRSSKHHNTYQPLLFRLFRHSTKENFTKGGESDGDYYSTGLHDYQRAKFMDAFSIFTGAFNEPPLNCVDYDIGRVPSYGNLDLIACYIQDLPKAYYHLGCDPFYPDFREFPTVIFKKE